MFYAAETGGDEWDVGVWAFGCGGAYFLIWTGVAGGALAGELGLWSWAMFGFGGYEIGGVFEGGGEVHLDGLFEGGGHCGGHGCGKCGWCSP